MITEFINGFSSVISFYFIGKLFAIAVVVLIVLLALTAILDVIGFLYEEKNK